MVLNPCCCIPLKFGVKVLALTLIIVYSVEISIISMCILSVAIPNPNDSKGWKPEQKTDTPTNSEMSKEQDQGFFIKSLLMFFMCLLRLIMNAILYNGAKNKDSRKCSLWLKCTSFLLFLDIGSLVLELLNRGTSTEWDQRKNFRLAAFGFTVYMMAVVYAFIREIAIEEENANVQDRWMVPELIHIEPNFLVGSMSPPRNKSTVPLRYPAYLQGPHVIPPRRSTDAPASLRIPQNGPTILSPIGFESDIIPNAPPPSPPPPYAP